MKASEMTNEELAKEFEGIVASGLFRSTNDLFRESAARLRLKQQSDNYAAALCRQEAEYKREICDLRRRLKVAEDALVITHDKMTTATLHEELSPTEHIDFVRRIASNALSAIRNEGGAPNKNTHAEFRLYHKITFKNGNSNGWVLGSVYHDIQGLKWKIDFERSQNEKYGRGKKIEFKVEVRNVTDWVDGDLDSILEKADEVNEIVAVKKEIQNEGK